MNRRLWLFRTLPSIIILVVGVVGICVGLAVGTDRLLGTFLVMLGSLMIFAGLLVVAIAALFRSSRPVQLSPENRSRLIDYLKVSRIVRAAMQVVVGVALIATGAVVCTATNQGFGWIIIGLGAFFLLVGAGNALVARRLYRPVAQAAESPKAESAG